MATHSRILAWRIPWTEEPGGLLSKGLPRVDTTEVTERARTAMPVLVPVSLRGQAIISVTLIPRRGQLSWSGHRPNDEIGASERATLSHSHTTSTRIPHRGVTQL